MDNYTHFSHIANETAVPESFLLSGFLPIPLHPCTLPSLTPPLFPWGNFSAERVVLRTRVYDQGAQLMRVCARGLASLAEQTCIKARSLQSVMGDKSKLELYALIFLSFPSRIVTS